MSFWLSFVMLLLILTAVGGRNISCFIRITKNTGVTKASGDKSLHELFDAMSWSVNPAIALAELNESIRYVRGSKKLIIPECWKVYVPSYL
jgi:hypothetical protein